MTLGIGLIIICLALVIVSALATILFLRPQNASEEEFENYRIQADIPSLFKTFEKIKIQYNQIGQGPDLVFLHGIGASTFIWRKILPILAKNFRVTAIDLPGFGRSQKNLEVQFDLDSMSDFIVRFLGEIGVDKFSLVGSSMGGAISLWIAKKYPKKCSRVLTIAAATHKALIRYPKFGLKMMRPLHFLINKKTMFVAVRNVVKQKNLVTDEMVNGYLLPFRDRGDAWRSFLSATIIIGDPRMPRELEELNSRPDFKNKILWGDDDRVVPRWVPEELKKILPKSEFEILPGLGHHPFEEDPELIAMLIQKFFV